MQRQQSVRIMEDRLSRARLPQMGVLCGKWVLENPLNTGSGVRWPDRFISPWHGACFNVTTGDIGKVFSTCRPVFYAFGGLTSDTV